MAWYHFLAIYPAGALVSFILMAWHDARELAGSRCADFSGSEERVRGAVVLVIAWPLVAAFVAPIFGVAWVYRWLIRVFTPKPKPAAPPPPPEPEHVPGNAYRDGGKACTCGARRG